MNRSPVRTGVCLVGLMVPMGCVVSSSTFEERTKTLQEELDASRERSDALEQVVGELLTLRTDSAEAARMRTGFADRLDRMEQDRLRLAELESGLQTHSSRIGDLATILEDLQQSPPMQAITRLDRDLSDLEAKVAVDGRMTIINRDKLDETIQRFERHEDEFERQMVLLGRYVQEQFVPLAEGLVRHLYAESERLQKNAQGLGDFAQDVDPYKFKHLQPGYTEAPPPTSADDDD